ncbi:MAG: hypothetical protein NC913_07505 [Candidatus Omnitrophica bacterium]|nr:hypothetical protein [Candidatus Omnitrophota bacterium]
MKNFVNFVSTDHYKSGVMGAEYLVSSGYKRIGFVGFIKDNTCSSQMYDEYCSCSISGNKNRTSKTTRNQLILTNSENAFIQEGGGVGVSHCCFRIFSN